MADAKPAVALVMLHEGEWANDPDDPGGPTNFGVSLKYAVSTGDHELFDIDGDGDIDAEDIRKLERGDALKIYEKWFDDQGYGDIDAQPVASKVMDLSVNMGPRQAAKILQRALRASGSSVKDDGVLGPVTMTAVNSAQWPPVVSAMCSEAASVYRQIVTSRPESKKFLKGWLNRAYFRGPELFARPKQ